MTTDNTTTVFIDVKEAAELLRVGPASIRKYAKLGMPHIKVRGRKLLFRPADILAWLAAEHNATEMDNLS